MAAKIQIRRDTAANWTATNPVLGIGETGLIIDINNKTIGLKYGDGVTAWNDLEEFGGGGGDGFEVFSFALSDHETDLTVGEKDDFDLPYNCSLTSLFIAVNTAPTGSSLIVDIKKNGVSIFSTKISIDATEKTSLTAAVPYVLTGAITFAIGDKITIHIDQIGATVAGASLKGYLTLIRT